MSKILVFLDHDIVIRHFIHSQSFRSLVDKHDVLYILPEKGNKRVRMDESAMRLDAPCRRVKVPSERLFLYRTLFQINRLRWKPGRQAKALRKQGRVVVNFRGFLKYLFLGLPFIFPLYEKFTYRCLKKQPWYELQSLFVEEHPDLVIHPTVMEGLFVNDLIDLTKKTKIPFVMIMNSWDNPSTKQALVGEPDWLLVWGQQTFEHALQYARMKPERTLRFGAAQFEIFKQQPHLTRNQFCKRHGLESGVTILLYAGSSKETDEFQHLVNLEKAIDTGRFGNLKIVYRPHPWGGGGYGGGRFLDHPWKHVVIEESMREYMEKIKAGEDTMFFPDYAKTHDVLSVIDALVSPLSTIILEGAMHGKPAMCFLPYEEKRAGHFQITVNLTHFEQMFKMDEIVVARGHQEFFDKLDVLLARVHENAFKDHLRSAMHFFVEPHEKPYCDRLLQFVEGII